MYSTYNKEKSVAVERFIITLKKKIFRQMTADMLVHTIKQFIEASK